MGAQRQQPPEGAHTALQHIPVHRHMTAPNDPDSTLFEARAFRAFEAIAQAGPLRSSEDIVRVRGRATEAVLRAFDAASMGLAVRCALWETALRSHGVAAPCHPSQSRALVALASALPGGAEGGPELREELLTEALKAARSAPAEPPGAPPDPAALAVVAAALDEPLRSQVAREAIRACQSSEPLDSEGRRQLLGLALCLPGAEARACLSCALSEADTATLWDSLVPLDPRLSGPLCDLAGELPTAPRRLVSSIALQALPAQEQARRADDLCREILRDIAPKGPVDESAYSTLARIVPFLTDGAAAELVAVSDDLNPTYGLAVLRALEVRRGPRHGGDSAKRPVNFQKARSGKEPARAAYLKSHARALVQADERAFFDAVQALSPRFQIATLASALKDLDGPVQTRAAAAAIAIGRASEDTGAEVLFQLAREAGALSRGDAAWVLVRCVEHLAALYEPGEALWSRQGHDLAHLAPLIASFGLDAVRQTGRAIAGMICDP
ncbi:MAG: hypothetical protein R3B70_20480 [Polyangiaceae bacterium]